MKLACELAVMDMDGEITAVAVGEDSAKFTEELIECECSDDSEECGARCVK